jgi:dolichol-phosphate mannosyltransferase
METIAQSGGVAVVIPCYRVKDRIAEVITSLGDTVDHIIVVDDCCPEGTADFLDGLKLGGCVRIIRHEKNQGVGGAMITGFRAALDARAEIICKMDGDGQMNPCMLNRLLQPLREGLVDYAKGSRFFHFKELQDMPLLRRLGNSGLTFLLKAASGYWDVSDPTNGYIAIRRETLELLDFDKLDRRYFFESSMLIQLGILKAVVEDIPMPARYGEETSSLRIHHAVLTFPLKLLVGLCRRIYWRYFFYTINIVSIFLFVGLLMIAFGVSYGGYFWYVGAKNHELQSAGTVLLAALPCILGFQLVLSAVILDVQDVPRRPLSPRVFSTR